MQNSRDSHFGKRKYFKSGDMKLSYLDSGGNSQHVLFMLHGHMNDARTFSELTAVFSIFPVGKYSFVLSKK
ncbi:hypothetical protein ACFSMW_16175 [Virgibacillus halophilus]|uniref:Alpha/beta hydrolase n=1 Tax=Tigheibacillus halophilus TaxID=361280 RepID=A0ABU5C445_9BACI|nr:hypothetical protein [Virgibacillus halophilus]